MPGPNGEAILSDGVVFYNAEDKNLPSLSQWRYILEYEDLFKNIVTLYRNIGFSLMKWVQRTEEGKMDQECTIPGSCPSTFIHLFIFRMRNGIWTESILFFKL